MSEERYTGRKPSPDAPAEVWARYNTKLASNLRYYHKRYELDKSFRDAEIERNRKRITEEYKTDPEFRQRMLNNAKAYYYKKKAEKPPKEPKPPKEKKTRASKTPEAR